MFSGRLIGVAILSALLLAPLAGQTRETLPAAISDREFWSLTEQLSEPDGYFRSNSGSPDNLLSNEVQVSTVAAELTNRVKASGVYLGVGAEQNFTRKRSQGLITKSTAKELMNAYVQAPPADEATFKGNLKGISDDLSKTRALPLGKDDLEGIE